MASLPLRSVGSPLARWLAAAYLLLVVYASLAPWSGWVDRGISPLAFATAPWPTYWTAFDLAANVAFYLPVGALLALALYPHVRGARTVVVYATVVGALLSAALEAIQTFLPLRVASNVDWLTNTAGALAGALWAAPRAPALLERGRLRVYRRAWFAPDSAVLLVVVALWPAQQLHLSSLLFEVGPGNGYALDWARDRGLHWLPAAGAWQPRHFMLAEAVASTAGLLAAGLAAVALMQPRAPRLQLLAALVVAALAVKTTAYGLRFGAQHLTAWATPGAIAGIAVGSLGLAAAATGRAAAAIAPALLATAVALAVAGVVPDNPYFDDWVAQWRSGRLAHFNAAAAWLAAVWPFALLAALIGHALTRARHR